MRFSPSSRLWNVLPLSLCLTNIANSCNKQLKILLLKQSFNWMIMTMFFYYSIFLLLLFDVHCNLCVFWIIYFVLHCIVRYSGIFVWEKNFGNKIDWLIEDLFWYHQWNLVFAPFTQPVASTSVAPLFLPTLLCEIRSGRVVKKSAAATPLFSGNGGVMEA